MAEYNITGTGDSATRLNEITADDVATVRNIIFGYEYGVINYANPFTATVDENKVTISKGLMFAYGYIGYLDKTVTFSFNRTAGTQYHFIYGELDKSDVPNTFKIKTKNNQASSIIKPTTFRQDILSTVKTGVFQLPLYLIKLSSNGVESITNVFEEYLYGYPKKAYKAETGTNSVSGEIQQGVNVIVGSSYGSNPLHIATLQYVHDTTRNYIDNR